MSGQYTADGRRRSSMEHAKHERYCSCGQIVHGNGATYQHRAMHERAADGHRYVLRRTFDELFPKWWELPWPARGARKVDGPRRVETAQDKRRAGEGVGR